MEKHYTAVITPLEGHTPLPTLSAGGKMAGTGSVAGDLHGSSSSPGKAAQSASAQTDSTPVSSGAGDDTSGKSSADPAGKGADGKVKGATKGDGGGGLGVMLAKPEENAAAAPAPAEGGSNSGSSARYDWMPSLKRSNPSKECIRRVRNDIRSLMRDPVPGLFVYPDEELVSVVHALVTGPFDTPYEGGLFYFVMHCPDDYPHNPPRVRLMTTGGGTVRFNPNLYPNGKVCLSILGTWNGPRWTPVHSVSSVLLSIQSLMSEKPYHNEPGFEQASSPQDVRDYSDCITHETLRVAVCSMVGDSSLCRSMPDCFRSLARDLFLSFVPRYELICEQNTHRDGEKMVDPFGQNKGIFRYAAIHRCIREISEKIQAESSEMETNTPSSSSTPAESESGSSASPSFQGQKACPGAGGSNSSDGNFVAGTCCPDAFGVGR